MAAKREYQDRRNRKITDKGAGREMPANDAALEALIEALRAKGEPDPVGRAHAIAAATTRIGRVYRGHHARATHPICLRKASHRLFIRDIACTSLKGQGRCRGGRRRETVDRVARAWAARSRSQPRSSFL